MPSEKLIWLGVFCCLSTLAVHLFPAMSFRLGVDMSAAWMVFAFGLFLIVVSTLIGGKARR